MNLWSHDVQKPYHLFARIRRESKYFRTQDTGRAFPVSLDKQDDQYIYLGGPGGRYRREDVELFAMVGGRLKRLC